MSTDVPEPQPAACHLQLTALPSGEWLVAGRLFVHDRPGELADVSSAIARRGGNIEGFLYNRSEDPSVVSVSARVASGERAGQLADEFRQAGRLEAPLGEGHESIEITDLRSLLRIKTNMEDRPGTLAAFAAFLREHRANVIYFAHDSRQSPTLVEMAMATESAEEVSALLRDLDARGYHYHVEWQGAAGSPIGDVIGLNAVERFLLNLKAVLPREQLNELAELLRSSKELQEILLGFRREAGGSNESMAASEIFTKILELGTASISKTGPAFYLRLTGPIELSKGVRLYTIACPTGANSYLLRSGDDYTLIDSGYGLYYPDAKAGLLGHGIDPSRIRRVLLTHADADHAGWAAHLEEDFGTEVYIHPDGLGIFEHENRAYGSDSRLMALNGCFTRLINHFTDLRAPKAGRPFPEASGWAGAFEVTGRVAVGDLGLEVLRSHGGHVPGQVFFYEPREGLLFSGDYLIDFASLSEREKSTLSIPRFLMTSTNADAQVFGREMAQLAALMLDTDTRLHASGRRAAVFPGHGSFYRVDETRDMLANLAARGGTRNDAR